MGFNSFQNFFSKTKKVHQTVKQISDKRAKGTFFLSKNKAFLTAS